MVGTRTAFTSEAAPCGRTVDGEYYHEEDEQGLIIYVRRYACGCRASHYEYHDGSIYFQALRHDGKVVSDEYGPEHGG